VKESSVILFYHELNGDFLAINAGTNHYYRSVLGRDDFEERAAAIEGEVGWVCSTAISRDYLRSKCKSGSQSQTCRAIGGRPSA
jgi:hypothetical protein